MVSVDCKRIVRMLSRHGVPHSGSEGFLDYRQSFWYGLYTVRKCTRHLQGLTSDFRNKSMRQTSPRLEGLHSKRNREAKMSQVNHTR